MFVCWVLKLVAWLLLHPPSGFLRGGFFLRKRCLLVTRFCLHLQQSWLKTTSWVKNLICLSALWWCLTNLVDPASSHMLVSKIKPCMSQYKLLHGETANGSLKQLSFIWWSFITWITMVILELIHAPRPNFLDGLCLLGTEPTQALPGLLVIHDNRTNRIA